MKLSDLIMGLFIFSALMLGMGTFFTGTATNYNVTSPALEGYGNTEEVNTMVNDMAAPLKEGQLTSLETPFVILSTGWTALTIPFRTTQIINSQITQAQEDIPNFPNWVIPFFQGLVISILVFSVLVAVTKVNV